VLHGARYDLHLDTHAQSTDACVDQIVALLRVATVT